MLRRHTHLVRKGADIDIVDISKANGSAGGLLIAIGLWSDGAATEISCMLSMSLSAEWNAQRRFTVHLRSITSFSLRITLWSKSVEDRFERASQSLVEANHETRTTSRAGEVLALIGGEGKIQGFPAERV